MKAEVVGVALSGHLVNQLFHHVALLSLLQHSLITKKK